VTPETEPDRGCCVTWQSLTGKWATDPAYGHTVMAVYQSMLSDALSQPPSG
jgi:flagellum-specific peptidoglycan hydrolase FlgJ